MKTAFLLVVFLLVYGTVNSMADSLPDTLILCHGDIITLDAGDCPDCTYLWQDGQTSRYYTVDFHGIYSLITTSPAEIRYDTILVIPCLDIYVPNAFSPGNNYINDVFCAISNFELITFHMQIYSRRGLLVFESHDITKVWDGSFKGKPCKQDVYVWTIQYESHYPSAKKRMQGTVTLVK